ncbi:DUF3999 domain-containing protein [Lysobacter korlensis]|uniref:DUF3999 domain-containing protein n=1 Tax=Lysobacter korlensis TaxID=553636 RepID=A0ABV6RKB2_9GAMM
MKRLMACIALLLPIVALATPRGDYAWQWPLAAARSDDGAFRVVLDETVYRRIRTPTLRDLTVIDRNGAAMPASLIAAAPPAARVAPRRQLPWFALPPPSRSTADGHWSLVTEADADGRLRRVDVRGGAPQAPGAPQGALLVDASSVRAPLAALELEWRDVGAVDAGYRIEASHDLEHWRTLATHGRLVDLRQDGRRLLQQRIEFSDAPVARYLRLTPEPGAAGLEITAVTAEVAVAAPTVPPRWLTLSPRPAAAESSQQATVFEYELDGRFPVHTADVELPGNHAVEWRLETRDDPEAPWRAVAGPWIAFRIGASASSTHSAPQPLARLVRDRYWRLRSSAPISGSPVLRLGYRPESLVFVAQGAPPYTLVAGSAEARRADAPVPALLDALRAARGTGWQPAMARLGAMRELAGEAALRPVRDWKAWLLWSVLGLAAITVAAFAASLLHAPRPARG